MSKMDRFRGRGARNERRKLHSRVRRTFDVSACNTCILHLFILRLADSWFEKEHPLHEPKDKDKKESELRPLIDIKELDNDNNTKSNTTKTTAKSKNPKKSIGFKKSVTLQRREKRRILPEITNRINRKDVDDTRVDQFMEKRDFTPPIVADSPVKIG